MKRSCVWGSLVLALPAVPFGGGCRTMRPEVPPPPNFARDGQKLGAKGKPVGFGSAPRAGYMTDAATQLAPGISAPGGDRTSIAGRDGLRESPTATIPDTNGAKGTLGRMFDGLGSTTSSARKDDAVGRAGYDLGTPASAPLDPPVSLPPPPLLPPPAAVSDPVAPPQRAQGATAPDPLPSESALPPPLPGPMP